MARLHTALKSTVGGSYATGMGAFAEGVRQAEADTRLDERHEQQMELGRQQLEFAELKTEELATQQETDRLLRQTKLDDLQGKIKAGEDVFGDPTLGLDRKPLDEVTLLVQQREGILAQGGSTAGIDRALALKIDELDAVVTQAKLKQNRNSKMRYITEMASRGDVALDDEYVASLEDMTPAQLDRLRENWERMGQAQQSVGSLRTALLEEVNGWNATTTAGRQARDAFKLAMDSPIPSQYTNKLTGQTMRIDTPQEVEQYYRALFNEKLIETLPAEIQELIGEPLDIEEDSPEAGVMPAYEGMRERMTKVFSEHRAQQAQAQAAGVGVPGTPVADPDDPVAAALAIGEGAAVEGGGEADAASPFDMRPTNARGVTSPTARANMQAAIDRNQERLEAIDADPESADGSQRARLQRGINNLRFRLALGEADPDNEFSAEERIELFDRVQRGQHVADHRPPPREEFRDPDDGPMPPAPEGWRTDGTPKGPGWIGSMPMTDGSDQVATELSVTVGASDVGATGEDVLIPLLVPTLTRGQVEHLTDGKEATDAIVKKAIAHARKQMDAGESPFFQGEVGLGPRLGGLGMGAGYQQADLEGRMIADDLAGAEVVEGVVGPAAQQRAGRADFAASNFGMDGVEDVGEVRGGRERTRMASPLTAARRRPQSMRTREEHRAAVADLARQAQELEQQETDKKRRAELGRARKDLLQEEQRLEQALDAFESRREQMEQQIAEVGVGEGQGTLREQRSALPPNDYERLSLLASKQASGATLRPVETQALKRLLAGVGSEQAWDLYRELAAAGYEYPDLLEIAQGD